MDAKLRHDLLTSGWSMIERPQWVDTLDAMWLDLCPTKLVSKSYEYYQYHQLPSNFPSLDALVDEITLLLREALPDENFHIESLEARMFNSHPGYWHQDGGYLRVIITCQGDGTLAALGFQNNIATPPGYALILTGQQRMLKTGIPQTWHAGPLKRSSERRLVLLNYVAE